MKYPLHFSTSHLWSIHFTDEKTFVSTVATWFIGFTFGESEFFTSSRFNWPQMVKLSWANFYSFTFTLTRSCCWSEECRRLNPDAVTSGWPVAECHVVCSWVMRDAMAFNTAVLLLSNNKTSIVRISCSLAYVIEQKLGFIAFNNWGCWGTFSNCAGADVTPERSDKVNWWIYYMRNRAFGTIPREFSSWKWTCGLFMTCWGCQVAWPPQVLYGRGTKKMCSHLTSN